MLITSRTGSKNKLLRIIFHSCTLNEHESIVHKFNSENTKLEMFFNIRQYQNYLLTSHLNMTIKSQSVKRLNFECGMFKSKVEMSPIRKNNKEKNAVICTEPLFLENKDYSSLSWWIEINKLSGYKKIILYNNSIPNTREFNRIFDEHKNFVEINQLKCLPNFIKPNEPKYLTHYNEFLSGEWNIENVHFLAFDSIANNECLYSNLYSSKFVLIQDNDEAFIVPRLEKFNTLTKQIGFLSESNNRYSLNRNKYPKRSDCNMNSGYLSDFLSQKNDNEEYSLFFQNVIFSNNDLIEIIFKEISKINFTLSNHTLYPLRLNITQKYISINPLYKDSRYGANFVLSINNANEMIYARNILDYYENVVRPFLNKSSMGVFSHIPENFKRFYFFKTPLVQPQYGKSLINLDSASYSDPHRPNGKVVELNEYYMSHFRTRAILEMREVPITSVVFDFNYFFCYFQPIFENFVNKYY